MIFMLTFTNFFHDEAYILLTIFASHVRMNRDYQKVYQGFPNNNHSLSLSLSFLRFSLSLTLSFLRFSDVLLTPAEINMHNSKDKKRRRRRSKRRKRSDFFLHLRMHAVSSYSKDVSLQGVRVHLLLHFFHFFSFFLVFLPPLNF
jgi:hypothetical protein